MIRVIILGSCSRALRRGHLILDEVLDYDLNYPVEVIIYTEDAEVGAQYPFALFDIHNELGHYLNDDRSDSHLGSFPPPENLWTSKSAAYLWECKALAIRLAERGARLQLRTSILDIDEEGGKITFRRLDRQASGVVRYDELYDYRLEPAKPSLRFFGKNGEGKNGEIEMHPDPGVRHSRWRVETDDTNRPN